MNKYFKYIITISFIIFLIFYLSSSSGYNEYQNKKQVELTTKQIKQFEQDISEGKAVDIDQYLKTLPRDYQNPISKSGLKISKSIDNLVEKTVKSSFKFLNRFVK